MAVDKLELFADRTTFFNVATLKTNHLAFHASRTWQGKLEKYRSDIEGNLVPKRYESIIMHYIQGTEHRLVERKVNGIRLVKIKSKTKIPFITMQVPYYEITLGKIISEEESKDKHMDFNQGKGFRWLR